MGGKIKNQARISRFQYLSIPLYCSDSEEFARVLWKTMAYVNMGEVSEIEEFQDVCGRVSRSMRSSTRENLSWIRITMVMLRAIQVRSRINFWNCDDGVGEKYEVPNIVRSWALEIDGKEHASAFNVKASGERVEVQLFPYQDEDGKFTDDCGFKIILTGPQAIELGEWLRGAGRMSGLRGSQDSGGSTRS